MIEREVGGGGMGGGVLLHDEELGDEEVELATKFLSVAKSKLFWTGPLYCFS